MGRSLPYASCDLYRGTPPPPTKFILCPSRHRVPGLPQSGDATGVLLRHNEKPTWLYKRPCQAPPGTGPYLPLRPLGTLKNGDKAPGAPQQPSGQHLLLPRASSWPDRQGFSMAGVWLNCFCLLSGQTVQGAVALGINRPQERLTREMPYFGWAGDRPLALPSSRGPSLGQLHCVGHPAAGGSPAFWGHRGPLVRRYQDGTSGPLEQPGRWGLLAPGARELPVMGHWKQNTDNSVLRSFILLTSHF